METKFCKKCGQEKSASDFYCNPRLKNGLSTYCKICTKELSKYKNKSDEAKEKLRQKRKMKKEIPSVKRIRERIDKKEKLVIKLLEQIKTLKSSLRRRIMS